MLKSTQSVLAHRMTWIWPAGFIVPAGDSGGKKACVGQNEIPVEHRHCLGRFSKNPEMNCLFAILRFLRP